LPSGNKPLLLLEKLPLGPTADTGMRRATVDRRTPMAFMATSEVPQDGTPPQIKVTVETVEELAAAMVSTPALVHARIVDTDNPEYGEGIQTRRFRGQERDLSEAQLYLGGRELKAAERKTLDKHQDELAQAVEKYKLQLRGVV
jgi:hypothetical protein